MENRTSPIHQGVVTSVNKSETHSLIKPPHPTIQLIAGLGIEGDAHLGKTVQHLSRIKRDPTQPNIRQVHLIHAELHDEVTAAGMPVLAGQMGENVTTRGLDILALPKGTRLRLGAQALIELTGLRNPCHQLNNIQPGLLEACLGRDAEGNLLRKAGVMAIILEGGEVKAGDAIEVILPEGEHVAMLPV